MAYETLTWAEPSYLLLPSLCKPPWPLCSSLKAPSFHVMLWHAVSLSGRFFLGFCMAYYKTPSDVCSNAAAMTTLSKTINSPLLYSPCPFSTLFIWAITRAGILPILHWHSNISGLLNVCHNGGDYDFCIVRHMIHLLSMCNTQTLWTKGQITKKLVLLFFIFTGMNSFRC